MTKGAAAADDDDDGMMTKEKTTCPKAEFSKLGHCFTKTFPRNKMFQSTPLSESRRLFLQYKSYERAVLAGTRSCSSSQPDTLLESPCTSAVLAHTVRICIYFNAVSPLQGDEMERFIANT